MRRQLIKITAYSIMSVFAVVLVAAVAAYVRLSHGPVALNFMTDTIQNQINRNLTGMSVTIGGAVIERAAESGVPHFRLQNLELHDLSGNLLARAPRAAIAVDESALLKASIVPVSLELIGPRIRIMRTLEGAIELGFSEAAPEAETTIVEEEPEGEPSGKTDQETAQPDEPVESGGTASLLRILSGGEEGEAGTIGSIKTIRIAGAAIKIYDEANDAFWDIPEADLAFQRMPYGFAVAAKADVSNGPQGGNWHADVTASYRRESRSFSISLRIGDLVPANVSDEVFALSQLARVKVPLAGQVDMEVTDEGLVTRASAEFSAAAGEVGFPDYLAEPIIIDEGALRADYDPVTGGLIINDSALLIGSSRAQVTGNVLPERDAEGRLSSVRIALRARNVAIDAEGNNKSPVAVDRIEFIGRAAIEDARLDIEDLVVMSGNAGVRIRGDITGGGESPGIRLSGRIRDLSSSLMKRLWPPIMAPKTRAWVNANIKAGRVSDAEFQVNLPVDSLARAQRERRLPPKSISLSFKVDGVTTNYLHDLPPLVNASGEARLVDNDFVLSVSEADVELPSGRKGKLAKSSMTAKDILAVETMATFDLNVHASAQALIEYLSHPDLNLITNAGFDTSKLSGDTTVNVDLQLPLIADVPKERVVVKAAAKIANAGLKDALPGTDLTDGQVDLTVEGGAIAAKGPVKISGIPAKISWQRAAGAKAKQSAVIEANLDGEERLKVGIDLGEFVRGAVGLKAVIADLGDPQGRMDIEADLSDADMWINAISWSRPATPKTHATLTYYGKGDGGRRIEDLVVKGPGLLIKGKAALGAKTGLREASFSTVRLSDENNFALTVKNTDNGTAIALRGDTFDARPLIKSMFSTRKGAASGDGTSDAKASPVSVSLNVDRVHAFRGEELTGVSGDIRTRGSRVEAAEINATFLSGHPVVFRVTPVKGGREMRINGRDGGAAIRAANLYGKVAGGQIEFYALMGNGPGSPVENGQLVLRNFQIRNEATLAELDAKGKPKRAGPRSDSLSFKRLTLPFRTDAKFVRIGESIVSGDEIGAIAEGLIRKSDGRIDITGTIIPAYAVNSALGEIPIFGQILTGGKGQGVFGVTFALGGTFESPNFQVNPVSAVAPGFLRKIFEFGGNSAPPRKKADN